ncbi:hypothetical protein SUGI_1076780 [Cryptomeria japonica]|nr:hypothetical protein SUGI_1076780 [Cryptomeria japonica]
MRRWMGQRWNLGGKVEVAAMLNIFFLFSFSNPNDCSMNLLDGPWFIGHNGLVLNNWAPGFNPLKEDTSKFLLWVQLPKFPLEFWGEEVFQLIANTFGQYLNANSVTKF